MSRKNQLIAGVVLLLPILMFQVLNTSTHLVDTESVAWYAANISEAKLQNQRCHDNPQIKSSSACLNSLHALKISFNGAN